MKDRFDLDHPIYRSLFEVTAQISSADEIREFFVDLFTPGELSAIAARWQVAQLVEKGISYREISEVTGASTATITRVGRSMQFGKGYQAILQKLNIPSVEGLQASPVTATSLSAENSAIESFGLGAPTPRREL